MQLIECRKMSKNYQNGQIETHVLKDINLIVNDNDFLGITGPSGSGKTTLMYVLSGLEKPTSGEVIMLDRNITQYSGQQLADLRKNQIGFVFQFYNLIPNLTVRENVLLALVIAKGKDESRVDQLLTMVGMAEFCNRYPNELSGGMQQRVAIARSLVNDPKIIFADEPTGNLDTVNGIEIMNLFHKLHTEQKRTIILVTHSDDYLKYCSRYIKLIDGKIVNDEVISV
ncbi:MAG: ABC transporter ATP-binding protein [Candidatus Izemoplasmatales bacterium]|jgi:putative ABC transport system ATP-binding protein|nr:ABC transporter ATP-binding protein [Candidatus Izemoplasmatales bacterium]MDD3864975.1 ABC transporter ATP-binding protein [Candidatus Izemoplasmatales bacterium]